MTRQEYNYKIVDVLKEIPKLRDLQFRFVGSSIILLPDLFKVLTEECPNQRAGQIFCNYICSDYREQEVSDKTKLIMETLFPNNPDPFFEESKETYEQLCSRFKN